VATFDTYEAALARAAAHARAWLESVGERPVRPERTAADLLAGFGGTLPEGPSDPATVVDRLASNAEGGLMAMGSGRFFGWVVGGTLPAALGADWLVSAWDQNTGLRTATPALAAAEEAAGAWLVDLFGLPARTGVGFVTGATMAHFVGLATGRDTVLARAGWDVAERGLVGAPPITVLVGAERHDTVDLALRFLGLGRPVEVAADDEGRLNPDALARTLAAVDPGAPILCCLQAGNLHSGAFDPFGPSIDLAHERGAWVHVDGAFGLWAAATPSLRHLTVGVERADSWSSDAHKTLNVPYDCGIALVADPLAMRASMGIHADYLIEDPASGDPQERVPELSRRARGVPVWAALASLGRSGVAELVDGLHARAVSIAEGIAAVPGATVMNVVVYTQVCVAFEDDERTRAITEALMSEGVVWMSGSRWHGRDVLRVSVSNWATTAEDVEASVVAVARAAAAH
jgi:glutamate/tyrosine decarboxylase-like PLP-dependent enzyme